MEKRCYYETLGVNREADEKELKSAFRKSAMKYHPDKNPGDAQAEAKFKELGEAYEVLKDPQSRAAYDQFGHEAFEGGGYGRRAEGFGPDFTSSMSDIFDDLFGDFMGGGRTGGKPGRERGSDLRYNLDISLFEAYTGTEKEINVISSSTCEKCDGSGAKPGSSPSTCSMCSGHGKVRATQGFFTIERTCPNCHGQGEMISDPCNECQGAGRTQSERTLSIKIPEGVEDGTRIRLTGEGDAGMRGGPAGDLYVFLTLKQHEFFQRDGADLFCRVPLKMTEAVLGTEIEVPCVDGGRAKVKIPEGTQNGKQFRLKGKGMPVLRASQNGDMYIQVSVETPVKLSKKQKELMKEFSEISDNNTNPESAGFFQRVKGFWDNFS